MTFANALSAFGHSLASRCVVTRPWGPIFDIDENGQMTLRDTGALYVGDILDFEDWTFEEVTE